MPTPDRHPGVSDEEGINMESTGVATAAGQLRYTGTRWSLQDSTGEFDPRTGSGLSEAQHEALRQLIHYINSGPTESTLSGAFREIVGGTFPTSVIWYEDNTKVDKIVELNLTYTGINPTTEEWKMYDTDGSTVLVTVSDAVTYSGVNETSRTRTIT